MSARIFSVRKVAMSVAIGLGLACAALGPAVWVSRSQADEAPMPENALIAQAALIDEDAHAPEDVHIETLQTDGWLLLIHGGAGVISPSAMTAEREAVYRAGLEHALDTGSRILRAGGSSLDAVEAAVVILEDNPLFNAGRGSVLNAEGDHELDASIMDGEGKQAGAVAGMVTTRNPIQAARAVMEHSEHVMFSSDGADDFAKARGLEQVDNDWFTTTDRLHALRRVQARRGEKRDKRGTVGAVALDVRGHVAAATSTGGMTGKAAGRTGDSPIIGAGTFADDAACAVSATGHGEFFIRISAAQRICARMELMAESPQNAAEHVLNEVAHLGGDGGVIVLSPEGEGAFVFNTPGMFRALATAEGAIDTRIYGDQD